MLNTDEIEEVIDTITSKILFANRTGDLENLLRKWELDDLMPKSPVYDTEKNGKIVVIGGNDVKEKELMGIIKSFSLDKKRFEFCLDYNRAKIYPYNKLRYNSNYRVVIFGPVPHSSTGKNDSSSVIAEMKNKEGYPRVEVLSSNNVVKLTKSNFKSTLQKLIDENYI